MLWNIYLRVAKGISRTEEVNKMQDLLYVSFDKDEKKNECGICIGRQNEDGSHTILKMELDEQAEILYKLLTEQGTKAAIVEENASHGRN